MEATKTRTTYTEAESRELMQGCTFPSATAARCFLIGCAIMEKRWARYIRRGKLKSWGLLKPKKRARKPPRSLRHRVINEVCRNPGMNQTKLLLASGGQKLLAKKAIDLCVAEHQVFMYEGLFFREPCGQILKASLTLGPASTSNLLAETRLPKKTLLGWLTAWAKLGVVRQIQNEDGEFLWQWVKN